MNTILENFFIDPETAVITNDKGEIYEGFVRGRLKK